MTEIWRDIEELTKNNEYYGQEIIQILFFAVEALLDRMQREIDASENPDLSYYLEVQKSSSELATQSMDHLVSNGGQWEQLINVWKYIVKYKVIRYFIFQILYYSKKKAMKKFVNY